MRNQIVLGNAYVRIGADTTGLSNGLKEAEDMVKSVNGDITLIAGSLSSIGGSVVSPLKDAIDIYSDFDRIMRLTQSVTQASSDEFARLREQALMLGSTTSWTSTQVAEGMLSLGRLGFDATGVDKTVSSVMDLGRALDIGVDSAAKLLGASMSQFGASASEATEYADALAAATNGAAIAHGELLETLKYVGSAAHATGSDIETVLALTMALRNSGLAASQAGTALRSMFILLQRERTMENFGKTFNVEIHDANGRVRSLLDILVDAQEQARALGDGLGGVLNNMFGKLVAPAMITLFKSDELVKLRDNLYNCSGAAEELRANMEGGVYGAMKLVESAIEGFKVRLVDTLMPALGKASQEIISYVTMFQEFIRSNPVATNMIVDQAVSFTMLGGAIAVIATGLGAFNRLVTLTTGIGKYFANEWNRAAEQVKQGLNNVGNSAAFATKKLTALRFAANLTRRALVSVFAGVATAIVWEGVLFVFQKISEYARKTAEQMKAAREAFEETMRQDSKNASEVKDKTTSGKEDIQRLVDTAGSDKPMNAVEKKKLDDLYKKYQPYVKNDIVVDENSSSGYRVKDLGSADRIKARYLEGVQADYQKRVGSVGFNLGVVDSKKYGEMNMVDYATAKKELASVYTPFADALQNMSLAQKNVIFGWQGNSDFTSSVNAINERYINALRTGSYKYYDRDKDIQDTVLQVIGEIKATGTTSLSNKDEKAIRDFLTLIATRNAVVGGFDDALYKNVSSDFGESFIAQVNKANSGSEFLKSIETLKGDIAAYKKDAKANEGKEYVSAADMERRTLAEDNARRERQTFIDEMTGKQASEKVNRFSQTELALERIEKQWADYVQSMAQTVWDSMDANERRKRFGADMTVEEFTKKKLFEPFIRNTEDNKERDQYNAIKATYSMQKGYYQSAALNEKKEQISKAKEQAESNASSRLNDIYKKMAAIFEKSTFTKQDEREVQKEWRNLNEASQGAQALGYDVSETRKVIVDDLKELYNSAKGELSSRVTFNAYEALDMSKTTKTDEQKKQLEELKRISQSAKNILDKMEKQEAFKEFI